MAQTIYLNSHRQRHHDTTRGAKVKQSVRLAAEKFGVIAGFLTGLLLGFGLLSPMLLAVDAPSWGVFLAGAVVTAAMTRIGQILSLALSQSETYGNLSEDL